MSTRYKVLPNFASNFQGHFEIAVILEIFDTEIRWTFSTSRSIDMPMTMQGHALRMQLV